MSVVLLSYYESDVRIMNVWQILLHKMAEKQLA